MTQTTARIKQAGKHFEIVVNMDKALQAKRGAVNDFLEIDRIFTDSKKGMVASSSDLRQAFGTDDVNSIAAKIVKSGEILVTQEHREDERERKFKQVIDFISKNAVDPKTGHPHSPDRIRNALEESHVNIKNASIESQIKDIIEQLSKILPIKIGTRKIRLVVPAVYTGKAYGMITQYKDDENWLSNGDLEVIVNIPSGIVIDFYEKLNSATHGSIISEEIKE